VTWRAALSVRVIAIASKMLFQLTACFFL
jgi:hypothetical protein